MDQYSEAVHRIQKLSTELAVEKAEKAVVEAKFNVLADENEAMRRHIALIDPKLPNQTRLQ